MWKAFLPCCIIITISGLCFIAGKHLYIITPSFGSTLKAMGELIWYAKRKQHTFKSFHQNTLSIPPSHPCQPFPFLDYAKFGYNNELNKNNKFWKDEFVEEIRQVLQTSLSKKESFIFSFILSELNDDIYYNMYNCKIAILMEIPKFCFINRIFA